MAESGAALSPLHSHEGRRDERTHMFVAAVLSSSAGSCPVQIRNMSRSGALIEAAVLPERETAVALRRGSLEAAARVIWKAGRKAGVAFDGTIEVAEWMARSPPSHQARVDEIVRGIRKEGCLPAAAPQAALPVRADISFAAELSALRDELGRLEHGLTDDAAVVAGHPEIQLLDIAIQRVGRLLAALPPR